VCIGAQQGLPEFLAANENNVDADAHFTYDRLQCNIVANTGTP
jgi:hypothetical protein